MAKQENSNEAKSSAKKIDLQQYTLKDDFPPKKKGEKIMLSEGGAALLKSKNLI